MTTEPQAVQDAVEAKRARLEEVSKDMDTAKPAVWADKKAAVLAAMEALSAEVAEAESELEAILFLAAQATKTKKAERNANLYRKRKVGNRLVLGGFGSNISKRLAESIEVALEGKRDSPNMHMNADGNFNRSVVCCWSGKAAEEHDFKASLMQHCAHAIATKKASLTKYLSDNQKMAGCLGKVDADMEPLGAFGIAASATETWEHTGHGLWLAACRVWSARSGPAAFPMPGFGCWVQSHSDSTVAVLAAIPAATILEKGVALADVLSFADTPSGCEAFVKTGCVMHLQVGAMAWVPYGWIPIPLSLDRAIVEDTGDIDGIREARAKQADDPSVGIYSVLTCWSKELAATLDNTVWTAIVKYNEEHIQKNASRSAWGHRATLLAEFVTAVKEERANGTF